MSELKEYVSYHRNKRVWVHGTRIHYKQEGYLFHGKYMKYFSDGTIDTQCFYNNGWRTGEYKTYFCSGKLEFHFFYDNQQRHITNEVEELVEDILNITPEEKMIIKIKFGVDCL